MRNNKLYESLSVLTKKSLEIIKESIAKNLVLTNESTWVKKADESYIRGYENRPHWLLVIFKSKDEITKTTEFALFSEIANSDEIISSQLNTLVGTCMGSSRIELFDIVSKSLLPFL